MYLRKRKSPIWFRKFPSDEMHIHVGASKLAVFNVDSYSSIHCLSYLMVLCLKTNSYIHIILKYFLNLFTKQKSVKMKPG